MQISESTFSEDIPIQYLHTKKNPLLVQPLQINISSQHITIYLGPEKAVKSKEHIGFSSKIKK